MRCTSCGRESSDVRHGFGMGWICPTCWAMLETEQAKKEHYDEEEKRRLRRRRRSEL